MKLTGLLGLLLVILGFGCSKEDVRTAPAVTTASFSNLSSTSVVTGGNILSDSKIIFVEKGICYGTAANPSVSDRTVLATEKTANFTVTLTNLTPKTSYYVRAYAKSSTGMLFYGNQVSFTTPEVAATSLFSDVQYSYTAGNILFSGTKTYTYSAGCNLYCKSNGGEFRVETFRSLRVNGGCSQGQAFYFTVKAPQVEVGKEYSLVVSSSGDAANCNWANFANPSELDSHFYIWDNDVSKVTFSVFTPNQIKGKISGKFTRFATGTKSDAEVSFDFRT